MSPRQLGGSWGFSVGGDFFRHSGAGGALAALIVIARYVAAPPRRRARELDIVGVGFFGVGLPGVIYGMSATQNGLTSPQAWIPLSAPG